MLLGFGKKSLPHAEQASVFSPLAQAILISNVCGSVLVATGLGPCVSPEERFEVDIGLASALENADDWASGRQGWGSVLRNPLQR